MAYKSNQAMNNTHTIITTNPKRERITSIETDYFGFKRALDQILTCSPYTVITGMKYYENDLLGKSYKGFSDEENAFIDALKRCGVFIKTPEHFRSIPISFEILSVQSVVQALKYGAHDLRIRKNADGKFEIVYGEDLVEYYQRIDQKDYSDYVFFKAKLIQVGYYK